MKSPVTKIAVTKIAMVLTVLVASATSKSALAGHGLSALSGMHKAASHGSSLLGGSVSPR